MKPRQIEWVQQRYVEEGIVGGYVVATINWRLCRTDKDWKGKLSFFNRAISYTHDDKDAIKRAIQKRFDSLMLSMMEDA
jgi:hypothetical protein